MGGCVDYADGDCGCRGGDVEVWWLSHCDGVVADESIGNDVYSNVQRQRTEELLRERKRGERIQIPAYLVDSPIELDVSSESF